MSDKTTPNNWIPIKTVSEKLYERHVLWLTDEAYLQITRVITKNRWKLTLFRMCNDDHPTDNHNKTTQRLWTKKYFTTHNNDTDVAKLLALEIVRDDVAPPYYATHNSKEFWTTLYDALNDAMDKERKFQKEMHSTWIGV